MVVPSPAPAKPLGRIRLRVLLAVVAAVPVVLGVALTGWLSLRNGERVVRTLVADIQQEVADSAADALRDTLDPPHLVNALNQDLLDLGLLDPRDQDQLQRHFHSQLQHFESAGYVQLGLADGGFLGVERTAVGFRVERTDPDLRGKDVWQLDGIGQRVGDPVEHIPGYRTVERTWYRAAVDAGAPAWSPIYQFSSRDRVRLGVTAVQPWRSPDGAIRGVLGTDIVLEQLGDLLQSRRLRSGGRVFVVERDGTLVGHTAIDPPFEVGPDQVARRLSAIDAEDSLTRLAAGRLSQGGGLASVARTQDLEVPFESDVAFVHVRPFRDGRGVDWLLVVAQPRSDYVAEIRAHTRATVTLCVFAGVGAVVLALVVATRVSAPILELAEAARGVAEGDWDRELPDPRTAEIADLAAAFQKMRAERREQERVLERAAERALEAQAAAEAASDAKTRFLANMSHELRTPLNAILGYAELIEEGAQVGDEGRADLDRIRRSGRHLLGLISDVLDLSRIEAGHLDLVVEQIDAVAVAREAGESCRGLIEAAGNTLVLDLPRVEVPVTTDATKLRQCLVNLLGNAAKFTEDGRVTLQMQVRPERVFFTVSDTGVGIAPDQLESVFAPFAQADDSQTRRQDGAGLGLAITREFARALGGAVSAVSVVGQGSRFTVELPRSGPIRRVSTVPTRDRRG